jgi:phosphatidate cytidylyltransferase
VNEKNKNLLIRVVTALTLLPAVLALVWWGGYWSAGLMAWAAAVCAAEYVLITGQRLGGVGWLPVVGAGVLPLLPLLNTGSFAEPAFWVVGAVFLGAWSWHLLRGPLGDAPTRAGHLLTAVVYGGMGLAALSALRLSEDGFGWVFAALVITWGNDTAAYFFGRFLGRHKLYPAVSPNKTWEGFFGGMAGSVGGMFLTRALLFPHITWVDALLLGLGGGLLGPLGDLCESMLKRAHGVKDSGKIIPGHGGLLDRLDALIFNAPWVYVYVTYLRGALG